jgi:hypothetical protein
MTENQPLEPNREKPEPAEKRRFDNVGDALAAGKNDGAAKAREKGPQLKSGVCDLVHDLAYGVAYGSVFAGAFLHELLPRSVREGISKGVSSGKEAGKEAGAKVTEAVSLSPEAEGPEMTNPSFS